MTDIIDDQSPPAFDVLLDAAEIDRRIQTLADQLAPRLRGKSWTAIVILLGATPFASDLLRALALRGVDVGFDALWLESYRDERSSSGRVVVRADIQRQIKDRGVLILDDVFDSGRTLEFARGHLMAKGAREAMTCVFARKPEAVPEGLDHWAYDAPPRYLVGYGMDDAGKWRGLPYLGAVPE
ncbi:MAG: hypoxanthine phosphoribosyltransferase [Hirschia sp.]|nr:hypoxanthine phosphoribosyltransferase [Hirschia sp.]MBF18747.1 hypoxanthine phosphoribosyltransferase [Hirschia sp.]MBF18942.1 hypoxanthine phosphoribosyltransferase [Hirschia sp.]